MSTKKILVISNTPFFGGGEQFIVSTLSLLPNINYYIVNNDTLAGNLPSKQVFRFSRHTFIGQLKEVRRINNQIRPDCIIFNGGNSLFWAPFIHCGHKILYRHTTNLCINNTLKRLIYNILLHISYLFADIIVHVSKAAYKEQILFKRKATVIYHGINPISYRFKSIESPIKFLFVGRTEPDKGIDIIVQAFSKVPKNLATLDIVGTGKSASWLESLSYANIKYHGFSEQTNFWYDSADVFISLPRHEAFGLTILEAMNHSLPIITNSVGGIPEIAQNGVNAIFVNRSIDSIYAAILYFCQHPDQIILMGEKSYEICTQQFSLDQTLTNIERIL